MKKKTHGDKRRTCRLLTVRPHPVSGYGYVEYDQNYVNVLTAWLE